MKYNSRKSDPRLPVHGFAGLPSFMDEDIVDISNNRYQNVAEANRQLPVGTRIDYNDGRSFVYVQMLGAAAALGTVLMRADAVAQDTVSSSTDLLRIETITGLTAGAHVGDYAYIDEGTGEGQCRKIVNNGTTWLELDRPLVTALAVADSDVTILRPYRVKKVVVEAANTSLSFVSGVSVGVITENYYGWIQVKGFCEHILVDDGGSTVDMALVADDATAGTALVVGANMTVEETIPFATALVTNVSTTVPGFLGNYGCVLA